MSYSSFDSKFLFFFFASEEEKVNGAKDHEQMLDNFVTFFIAGELQINFIFVHEPLQL